MSRWSNRFISETAVVLTSLLTLLSACQSAPTEEPPAAEQDTVAGDAHGATAGDAAAAGGAATGGAGGAAASNGAASGGAAKSPAAPVPGQATQEYTDALNMMRAGRSGDAELKLKELDAAYPQLSGPPANLGLLYLQASQLPQAESAFKTALERNPENAVAGNELGIVERRLGKFTEAEAAYQRTIAAAPNYAPTYLNLGVLYDLYLAEPKKALEQFEHYVQLAGENKQVAGWMAELRKRVGASSPPVKKEPT